MIAEIAFMNLFGLPLIAYGGMFTFLVFLAAAYCGITRKPVKIHKGLAITALALALIHGIIGILALLGI